MNSLKIYIFDTSSLDVDTFTNSLLNNEDIERLTKYKVEEVKKEKAVSLYFKNKYIGEYHYNDHGKPISDNKEFNISHSKGMVAFVMDESPIGIDIEKIRPVDDDLRRYISSNEELDYITSYERFFEIWTNKEALVKAIGTGLASKVIEIPSLPINGVREYKGQKFAAKTIRYSDYVLTVVRSKIEDFNLEIVEEKL